MKSFKVTPLKAGLALVATLGAVVFALAQQPAAPAPSAQIKIKTMPKPNRVNVPTPEFSTRGSTPPSLTRKSREWAVIDVVYETKTPPKVGWTDNVTAVFYVLAETMNADRAKEFSFYTLTVRYVNVPDGEHKAGVVLAPSTLERFGNVVAIACEITADGAAAPVVQSEHTASELNQNKDDWWKNPRITDSPITKKRDGLLLERSKTIFGLINSDDYEAVR